MSAMPWPVDPPALRKLGESHEAVVERDLLATLDPLGRRGRVWIVGLASVVGCALLAWIYQLVHGLRVTDMGNVVSWGTYMTNFVFFIGISHAGTLISAILRVTDAGWRRPITRMAEAITCIALLVGASMVVIDMGRPDRALNLLLHGRFQSPMGPRVGHDVSHGQLLLSVRGDDPRHADPRQACTRTRPFAVARPHV
jgi:hypothetical protein